MRVMRFDTSPGGAAVQVLLPFQVAWAVFDVNHEQGQIVDGISFDRGVYCPLPLFWDFRFLWVCDESIDSNF